MLKTAHDAGFRAALEKWGLEWNTIQSALQARAAQHGPEWKSYIEQLVGQKNRGEALTALHDLHSPGAKVPTEGAQRVNQMFAKTPFVNVGMVHEVPSYMLPALPRKLPLSLGDTQVAPIRNTPSALGNTQLAIPRARRIR